jgi:hypothetical protein
MRIPHVIDNQGHKLADALNNVMQNGAGHSLDIASAMGEADVFEIQEKVKAEILNSIQTQTAMEVAPKIIDGIQKTIASVLQANMSNPA